MRLLLKTLKIAQSGRTKVLHVVNSYRLDPQISVRAIPLDAVAKLILMLILFATRVSPFANNL